MKNFCQSNAKCIAVILLMLFAIMQVFISSTHNEVEALSEEPAPVVTETATVSPTLVKVLAPVETIQPTEPIEDTEAVEVETETMDILDEPSYDSQDAMCIANMLFGEISAIIYDENYTAEEQDHIMQEWACIPLNHIQRGIADSIPELMRLRLSSGYFVWHPRYAEEWYAEQAEAESPEIYERCMANAIIVLTNQMQDEPPEDVIYADLKAHGAVYKSYYIDTGYYRTTVYLSRA